MARGQVVKVAARIVKINAGRPPPAATTNLPL
jgi:hypothetical protein